MNAPAQQTATTYQVPTQTMSQQTMTVRFPNQVAGTSKSMLFFAAVVILLTAIAVILTTTNKDDDRKRLLPNDGTGIWMGCFLAFTAAAGILAVTRSSRAWMTTFLVLTIFACFAALIIFIISLAWAGHAGSVVEVEKEDEESHDYEAVTEEPQWDYPSGTYKAISAVYGIAGFFALVYAVTAVVASCFACSNTCGCPCKGDEAETSHQQLQQMNTNDNQALNNPTAPAQPYNPGYTQPTGYPPNPPYNQPAPYPTQPAYNPSYSQDGYAQPSTAFGPGPARPADAPPPYSVVEEEKKQPIYPEY